MAAYIAFSRLEDVPPPVAYAIRAGMRQGALRFESKAITLNTDVDAEVVNTTFRFTNTVRSTVTVKSLHHVVSVMAGAWWGAAAGAG
jgi:hypothetical protein